MPLQRIWTVERQQQRKSFPNGTAEEEAAFTHYFPPLFPLRLPSNHSSNPHFIPHPSLPRNLSISDSPSLRVSLLTRPASSPSLWWCASGPPPLPKLLIFATPSLRSRSMANDPKEPPKSPEKQEALRGKRPRGGPGPWPPRIEPFMAPTTDLNPRDLKTWAKRTGFNPNFSGETASVSSDLESGSARWEAPRRPEIEAVPVVERVRPESLRDGVPEMRRHADLAPPPPPSTLAVVEPPPEPTNKVAPIGDGGGSKGPEKIEKEEAEVLGIDLPEFAAAGIPAYTRRPLVRKTSCLASLSFYSLQHYLSLAGSLVFVPLVLVPVMGGTDEETATVVSTVLLVTGIATLLHSYLGTRLPLVQGSSFVYLAPALAIANSREFRNLSENRFKHIMKELQGAIIVGSIFQCIFGYSGLMSLFLRFINPVTIAPTVAAVGLAFFGYAFPQAGTCIELSIPQLVLIIVFTLYLRRVSIYGHRIFQVYAVPLGVAITWVYASLLTASGAYNFKGCDPNIPTSNILYEACRKHAIIMKHCRTDVSDAWRTSAWFRIPYPFQWGLPTFRLRTCMIMVVVSVIASIDSVSGSSPNPGTSASCDSSSTFYQLCTTISQLDFMNTLRSPRVFYF